MCVCACVCVCVCVCVCISERRHIISEQEKEKEEERLLYPPSLACQDQLVHSSVVMGRVSVCVCVSV